VSVSCRETPSSLRMPCGAYIMGGAINQHFVPQFYFRFFNGGSGHINLVRLRECSVIQFAPIKGQCARRKFYGFEDVEQGLSKLESQHACALKALRKCAWDETAPPLTDEQWWRMLQAILIQRERTPRAGELHATGAEEFALYGFRAYLETLTGDPMAQAGVKAIDEGKIHVRQELLGMVLMGVQIAMRSVIGIADLESTILRNHTANDFIFGDSPAVFYNHYLRGQDSRGALGLQSRGLIILLPLDGRTQLMLYDSAVYAEIPQFVEILSDFEVSQLNAAQIHSARDTIYFGDQRASEYVSRLVRAHKPMLRETRTQFIVHKPGIVEIDGIPSDSEVFQSFEPQISLVLDFSFLKIVAPPHEDGTMRHRNAEIARMMKEDANLDDLHDDLIETHARPEIP